MVEYDENKTITGQTEDLDNALDAVEENKSYYQPMKREVSVKYEKDPGYAYSVVSMACGIGSILLVCCLPLFAIITGIVSIVFFSLSRKQNGGWTNGFAKAGLICGIIGLVFCVVLILCGAAMGILSYFLENSFFENY